MLARSAQVGGLGKDEDLTRIALTSEAGLNEDLAFPFVWAAIALVTGTFDWAHVIAYDGLYRVGIAIDGGGSDGF